MGETGDEPSNRRPQEAKNRGEDFDLCEEDRRIEDARVDSTICLGIDVEPCPFISNSVMASVAPPDSCTVSDRICVSERTDFGQREMSTSFERPDVPETIRAVELSAKTEPLSAAVEATMAVEDLEAVEAAEVMEAAEAIEMVEAAEAAEAADLAEAAEVSSSAISSAVSSSAVPSVTEC